MGSTWIVIPIKAVDGAKQRLSAALSPCQRLHLARQLAGNSIAACLGCSLADKVLVVAGDPEVAEMACSMGAEVLGEATAQGQSSALETGIGYAVGRGAQSVLLISADLPLLTTDVVSALLAGGQSRRPPAAVAAPAIGRQGTNALFLNPPQALALHFGDASLPKFQAEARSKGIPFDLYEDPALALDLDEPEDLKTLASISPQQLQRLADLSC